MLQCEADENLALLKYGIKSKKYNVSIGGGDDNTVQNGHNMVHS